MKHTSCTNSWACLAEHACTKSGVAARKENLPEPVQVLFWPCTAPHRGNAELLTTVRGRRKAKFRVVYSGCNSVEAHVILMCGLWWVTSCMQCRAGGNLEGADWFKILGKGRELEQERGSLPSMLAISTWRPMPGTWCWCMQVERPWQWRRNRWQLDCKCCIREGCYKIGVLVMVTR